MRKQLLRERIFFYILLALLVFLSVIMVWPYLNAILLAIAVVVIMHPVYRRLLERGWIKGSA
jgi:predicted PurR-regulated permease PerM